MFLSLQALLLPLQTFLLSHQTLPSLTKLPSCPEAAPSPGWCPVLPCLHPAVPGVRQMPLEVCIQRCGGRCSSALPTSPCLLHVQRTVSPHSPWLVPTCQQQLLASHPLLEGSAGPQLTSDFLIARKWLIPPGLVSMVVQSPQLWPLPSFWSVVKAEPCSPLQQHFPSLHKPLAFGDIPPLCMASSGGYPAWVCPQLLCHLHC